MEQNVSVRVPTKARSPSRLKKNDTKEIKKLDQICQSNKRYANLISKVGQTQNLIAFA